MKNNERKLQATFLSAKIENLQGYHNHKEVMVNAGFILQLTLFATIIMENIWPPQWVEGDSIISSLSTCIVYSAFWILIHGFITWQLQNKIIASLYINGYEAALRKLVFGELSKEEYALASVSCKKKRCSAFKRFVGHIVPFKKQTQRFDINVNNLPQYVCVEIEKSLKSGTAAKGHERLMVFSSLFIWGIIMIRMFANLI